MNITTKQGTVIEYYSIICKGKVKTIDGEIYQFHSTSFQSSLPTRFPYLGEDVIITFDDDRLISIRTDVEKQKSYYDLPVKPVKYTESQKFFAKSITTEEYLKILQQSAWSEIAKLE